MADPNEVLALVESFKDSGKTYAEFIAVLFKDKFIEVYLGDSYEEVSTEQVSTSYPAVLCGKVIGAYRECLIINSVFEENKTFKLGNVIFLNERAIRALNEIDGKGIFEDMLFRSRESVKIKSTIENSLK